MIIGVCILVAVIAGVCYYTTHVSLKKKTITAELGKELSKDISKYADTTGYTKKVRS